MRPLGARVLVKRMEAPRPKSSIIEIPDTVEGEPSQYGLVLAIGTLKHGGFGVGDTVLLTTYAGAPARITIDGEVIEGAIVPEDAVLAVVEDL